MVLKQGAAGLPLHLIRALVIGKPLVSSMLALSALLDTST